jgi:hypothetical protein
LGIHCHSFIKLIKPVNPAGHTCLFDNHYRPRDRFVLTRFGQQGQ